MPLEEVTVSVLDRSFLFGDAVYEVIRIYRGQPFLLGEHLQRLKRSLQELRIQADVDAIADRSHATLKHSSAQEAILYIHISRGVAPRTHHFPEIPTDPNVLIYVKQIDPAPNNPSAPPERPQSLSMTSDGNGAISSPSTCSPTASLPKPPNRPTATKPSSSPTTDTSSKAHTAACLQSLQKLSTPLPSATTCFQESLENWSSTSPIRWEFQSSTSHFSVRNFPRSMNSFSPERPPKSCPSSGSTTSLSAPASRDYSHKNFIKPTNPPLPQAC